MATAQQQMNGQPMNGSYYNNEQQQASSTSSAQAVSIPPFWLVPLPSCWVSSAGCARQVGEQFQRQYYDILSKQPIDLYRFYTDHSKMTTIHLYENAPPKIASVTGQKVRGMPAFQQYLHRPGNLAASVLALVPHSISCKRFLLLGACPDETHSVGGSARVEEPDTSRSICVAGYI